MNYFSFFNLITSEGQPLTPEKFRGAVGDPALEELIGKIREEKDEEKQRLLKQGLPCVTFQAYSEAGRHTKATCKSNGFYGVDFDHLDDPRAIYESKIKPLIKEFNIVMVCVSARGKGLHVVAMLSPMFTTIEQNHRHLGDAVGLTPDENCFDISRVLFMPCAQDILYYDEEAMFYEFPEAYVENPDFGNAQPAPQNKAVVADKTAEKSQNEVEAPEGQQMPDSGLMFHGVPVKNIMADYWLEQGGIPMPGERHKDVMKSLHILKYACDFDAEKMRLAIGDAFGLPQDEVNRMIKDTLAYRRSNSMPFALYRILKRHGAADDVTEVDANEVADYPVDDEDIPHDALPALVKAFVKTAPMGYQTAMIHSVLTIIGFLLTRIRFMYRNPLKPKSLTLMTTIEGSAASGKSNYGIPFTILTKLVRAKDDMAIKQEHEYKDKLKKCKNKAQQPDDPKPIRRIVAGRCSVSKLIDRMVNAQGLHIFSFESEISSVTGNQQCSWGNKSSIYRNSFDNDRFSQDYKSDSSTSDDVDVFYNFIFTGTPDEISKFYRNAEDGTVTRMIPLALPDRFGQKMPTFGTLSLKETHMVDKFINDCENRIFDADGNIKDTEMIDISWLMETVDDWCQDRRLEALKSENRAMNILYIRAAEIAVREAVIAYILFGKRHKDLVKKFFCWAAQSVLNLQLNRFGEAINAVEEKRLAKKSKTKRVPNSVSLFDSLPETFTSQDLERKKVNYGITRDARHLISDWVRADICRKVAPNQWRKIDRKEMTA